MNYKILLKLNSTEEQPGCELTDVVYPDHVLLLEVGVAGPRVGLSSHQLADVGGEVAGAVGSTS